MDSTHTKRLLEVCTLFLKLGITAFGGPAAHIAMFHDETVKRRKWLTEDQFIDFLGASNIIPGPNSTELVIHIGFLRAGWAGLIVAGLCFVTPAALIVLFLSWLYVKFGATPQVGWILDGIKPVVIAIIAQALWSLSFKVFKSPLLACAGIFIFVLYLLGINEIALLFGGGLTVMVMSNIRRLREHSTSIMFWSLDKDNRYGIFQEKLTWLVQTPIPFSLGVLFLTCLKIGAILYGSGYVLFAFLRADFVFRLGWLTDQQLLDAIAIGQVTPGPLFTAATFIGYLLAGTSGALLATLGIFLPSFLFVAISNPLIPRIRASLWLSSFLDGVNACSLGLMAGVTFQLTGSTLINPGAIAIAISAFILLIRFKINTTWLIFGGAMAGYLFSFFK